MRFGDAPVCPGCWGLDAQEHNADGECICPNPKCLVGWFHPDDPNYQPCEFLFTFDLVIGPGDAA